MWQGRCAGAGSWSQHGGQPGSVLRCGSVGQPHTIQHLMVPSPNHSTAQTGQGFAGRRGTAGVGRGLMHTGPNQLSLCVTHFWFY